MLEEHGATGGLGPLLVVVGAVVGFGTARLVDARASLAPDEPKPTVEAVESMTTVTTAAPTTMETTTTVAPTTTEATTETASSDERTFVGVDGVTTTITDVSRIVSLTGDFSEIIFELGLGDNVVGVDVTTTYPPEAAALNEQGQTVGFAQDLAPEAVLRFEPDRHERDQRDDVKRGLGQDIPVQRLGANAREALRRLEAGAARTPGEG